jgi:hypothetical protein
VRRTIPDKARLLKKYLACGGSASTMSDHDDAPAGLIERPSGPAAVHNSPCDAIPQLGKASDEPEETGRQSSAENVGDILPDKPAGIRSLDETDEAGGEAASRSVETGARNTCPGGISHAVILTGRSSDKKVNWSIFIAPDGSEIAVERRVGIVVCEDSARGRLDLAIRGRLPAERLPRHGARADPGADVEVSHQAAPC